MRTLLSQLIGSSRTSLTVVVMDGEHVGRPVQHHVRPRALLMALSGAAAALVALVLVLVFFTPVRTLVPGYGTAGGARAEGAAGTRLAALEDSLRLQQEYLDRFRALLSGQVAPPAGEATAEAAPPARAEAPRPRLPQAAASEMPTGASAITAVWTGEPTARLRADEAGGLPLPAPTPVQGFVTRGFDARTGHFGVDVATGTGAVVRTVGDGFVIFADWTYEGGHTLAIQHAGGYVSVYKHNERLLRRVGERVRARDAIAVSGNTGEVSTGPHLHFELWRDGLPQDARAFVVGW